MILFTIIIINNYNLQSLRDSASACRIPQQQSGPRKICNMTSWMRMSKIQPLHQVRCILTRSAYRHNRWHCREAVSKFHSYRGTHELRSKEPASDICNMHPHQINGMLTFTLSIAPIHRLNNHTQGSNLIAYIIQPCARINSILQPTNRQIFFTKVFSGRNSVEKRERESNLLHVCALVLIAKFPCTHMCGGSQRSVGSAQLSGGSNLPTLNNFVERRAVDAQPTQKNQAGYFEVAGWRYEEILEVIFISQLPTGTFRCLQVFNDLVNLPMQIRSSTLFTVCLSTRGSLSLAGINKTVLILLN